VSTKELWTRLARPLDPVRAAEALLGISHSAAAIMTSALFVTSSEVDELVDELPRMVRSLAISSAVSMEVCHGEVRGPVQWAETMSLRANAAGDENFFVCSSPRRAYDTAENRVLVAALGAVSASAALIDTGSLKERDSPFARHIRHNGALARRYLEHRALSGVPRGRPSRRDRSRARAGTRSRTYAPALAVLGRHAEPMSADEVAMVTNVATAGMHAAATAVLVALEERGHEIGPLRVRDRAIVGGPFVFAHPRGQRGTGITVAGHELGEGDDADDLLDRAGL
jgi:hypothetical protein